MRLDQQPDGAIPSIVPDVKGIQGNRCGGPGWSDAATVVPWEIYIRTGDLSVLEENFDMMCRWVAWYEGRAQNHIIDVEAYGDWLQPNPASGNLQGDTPRDLIGTAYFARSADLTAQAARRLGKTGEAGRLEVLFATVKTAFATRFFNENGRLTTANESQTGYLLALGFDLLPEPMRPAAAENLVRLVGEADGHLRTGFLGTPLLAPVLDRFGRTDLAYQVLFKETYPSWFYSIHQGATTMWERWNSYSHEHGFGDAAMNSFNHYAYGAIGQWMHERIAGLAPDPAHPGYKHFFIQPAPGGPLNSARAELMTPYGMASSAWILENHALKLEAIVPPNTTATLILPGKTATKLPPGRHVLTHRLQ
jgi:alpha-L-rhamnosidase